MKNSKRISKNRVETYFDTTDDSLLGWYEFDASSGDMVDLLGRAGDATIVSTANVLDDTIGTSASFPGSNYAEVQTPSATLQSIVENAQTTGMALSIWVKPSATVTEQAIVAQRDAAGTGRTWLNFFETITGKDYITCNLGGGVYNSAIIATPGQWYHCVVNYKKPAPGDTYGRLQGWINGELPSNLSTELDIDEGTCGELRFAIDKAGANAFDGSLHQCLVYNRSLQDSEIRALYNKGVVQFQGGYGHPETGVIVSGTIGSTQFIRQSGSYKISTDTINGERVKVIECTATGTFYAPVQNLNMEVNEAAYGTWEWWMYKNQKANDIAINFIDDNTTIADAGGYGIRWRTGDELRLTEYGVAEKFQTVDDYIASGSWYGIKVTRSPGGTFTTYIRGGSFGNDYVVVNPTGGLGANPFSDNTVTSGAYLLIQLSTGDKLAWGGISDKYSFTKNLTVR